MVRQRKIDVFLKNIRNIKSHIICKFLVSIESGICYVMNPDHLKGFHSLLWQGSLCVNQRPKLKVFEICFLQRLTTGKIENVCPLHATARKFIR